MTSLRVLGWLGAFVIAVLVVGALGGAALAVAGGDLPVTQAASGFGVVGAVALFVVVAGGTAARTRSSTYW